MVSITLDSILYSDLYKKRFENHEKFEHVLVQKNGKIAKAVRCKDKEWYTIQVSKNRYVCLSLKELVEEGCSVLIT